MLREWCCSKLVSLKLNDPPKVRRSHALAAGRSAGLLDALPSERAHNEIVPVESGLSLIRGEVTERLAGALVADLPEWARASCADKVLDVLQRRGELRVASIFSGSDMDNFAARCFLDSLHPPNFPRLPIRHVMSVEHVEWKRNWIMLMQRPERLYSDAAQLTDPEVYDYASDSWTTPPDADLIKIGFSCKCFSSLNNSRHDFDQDIMTPRGSSGQTAQYSLQFLAQKKPSVVLLENVPGLCRGYMHLNQITQTLAENLLSNLSQMLRGLQQIGYITPVGILDASARMDVLRTRAWLPCYFWPDVAHEEAESKAMATISEDLMCALAAPSKSRVLLSELLMETERPLSTCGWSERTRNA